MSCRVECQEAYLTALFQATSAPHRPAQLLQPVNSDQINGVHELADPQ